ncbi:hypothetical protein [Hydrogenivirga sp.]
MRFILSAILLFLLSSEVYPDVLGRVSGPQELEVRIIEKLFQDLLGKDEVKVFVVGDKRERYVNNIRKFSHELKVSPSCDDADIVLIAGSYREGVSARCKNKPFFSTRREHAFSIRNCLGAFYWKKGRPNILLIKERLEERGIKLPPEYKKFIESIKESKAVKRGVKI